MNTAHAVADLVFLSCHRTLLSKASTLLKYKNVSGVYIIKNLVNGKIYVGSSIDLYDRLMTHGNPSRWGAGNRRKTHFYRSIAKYEAHNFEIIDLIPVKSLKKMIELENEKMDEYNSLDPKFGYNCRRAGANGCSTPEACKGMSDSHLNGPNYEIEAARCREMGKTAMQKYIEKHGVRAYNEMMESRRQSQIVAFQVKRVLKPGVAELCRELHYADGVSVNRIASMLEIPYTTMHRYISMN